MRWLVCVALALGILAAGFGADYIWPSGALTSKVSGTAAAPLATGSRGEPPGGTMTVEGDGLSPVEKQPLAEGFRQILSDGLHAAVNKSVEDLVRDLRIADDLERKLLAAADGGSGRDAGPEPAPDVPVVWSIHLIRPGRGSTPDNG